MNPRPKIKICGLTRAEDALLATELGAWALGMIFHPKSPRLVDVESAARIVASLGTIRPKTVGVFVNASLDDVVSTVKRVGLSGVQLHGDEDPEFCAQISARLPGVDVIKALRPRTSDDLENVAAYGAVCDAVLLDAFVEGVPGGTGRTGDWSLATRASRDAMIILAGGLTPENIRDAMAVKGIYAVDASSGLEESPGRKSSDKLKAFFKNSSGEERP